jgi:hypothetical protein
MRAALNARGGGCCSSLLQLISHSSLENYQVIYVSLKTAMTKVHPYRNVFSSNSKIIIENIFQDYTARRYILGSTQKFKTIAPTYLDPIAST